MTLSLERDIAKPLEYATIAPALPSPRSPRYYSLDFWRGLACVLVVLSHVSIYARPDQKWFLSPVTYALVATLKRLWIGVPIFFVISGYCISATADAARLRSRPVSDYFKRRLRRIYPPYWVWLAVCVLMVLAVDGWSNFHFFTDTNVEVPNPMDLGFWQWFGNLTLTETWRRSVIGPSRMDFLGHAWTLCYEEQFYAVTGLVLLLAPRKFFRAFAAITVFVAIGALITVEGRQLLPWAGTQLLHAMGSNRRLVTGGLFVDGRWLMFAAGILVYYQINYGTIFSKICAYSLLGIGMIYAGRHPRFLFETHPNNLDQSFFVAYVFAIGILLLHPFDREMSKSKMLQPIMFCGRICYSLYLVHWPVVKIVGHGFSLLKINSFTLTLLVVVPVGVAISVGVAWIFHLLVERHFLNPSQLKA